MKRGAAMAIVALACAAVVLLIGIELRSGARDYGVVVDRDPCVQEGDPFPQGSGIDGTLQRIALGGLDGAACELGVSREVLVLSVDSRSGFEDEVTWDKDTLESALEAGLLRAIDDANDRNTIPGFLASILEVIVKRAPLDWLLGLVDVPFIED